MIDLNNKKLLIVRLDNIGDLVCTTPLIEAIKKSYPNVILDVLVNTYNEQVLKNNPYIRKTISYEKAKHSHKNKLQVYLTKLKFFLKIRQGRYDYAIIAGCIFKKKEVNYAKVGGVKQIIGYYQTDLEKKKLDIAIYYGDKVHAFHEVEKMYELGLKTFNLPKQLPKLSLFPDQALAYHYKNKYQITDSDKPIGIHISSRTPEHRWPVESFILLIKELAQTTKAPLLMFWSPGSENELAHPGDDEKADVIKKAISKENNIKFHPIRTTNLTELIAGISICKEFFTSEGGTAHIAAALVERMVVIFGKTGAFGWYPWKVTHKVLQKPSALACDVSVSEVLESLDELRG